KRRVAMQRLTLAPAPVATSAAAAAAAAAVFAIAILLRHARGTAVRPVFARFGDGIAIAFVGNRGFGDSLVTEPAFARFAAALAWFAATFAPFAAAAPAPA